MRIKVRSKHLLALLLLQKYVNVEGLTFQPKVSKIGIRNMHHYDSRRSSFTLLATKDSWIDDNDEFSKGLSRRSILGSAATAAAAFTTTSSGLILPSYAAEETTSTIDSAASSTSSKGPIPTIKLGKSSLEVSRTIQGYWQLAGGHGKYKQADAIDNMKAHYDAGITTLDTADIYGPSELIVGNYMKTQPNAIPCTKFCCFKFLDEIDKTEVRTRIEKVSYVTFGINYHF